MKACAHISIGGLSFARHWFRADYNEFFGDDYNTDLINGRTFYAKHCEDSDDSDWKDPDLNMPINYCLGGKEFLQNSWSVLYGVKDMREVLTTHLQVPGSKRGESKL